MRSRTSGLPKTTSTEVGGEYCSEDLSQVSWGLPARSLTMGEYWSTSCCSELGTKGAATASPGGRRASASAASSTTDHAAAGTCRAGTPSLACRDRGIAMVPSATLGERRRPCDRFGRMRTGALKTETGKTPDVRPPMGETLSARIHRAGRRRLLALAAVLCAP